MLRRILAFLVLLCHMNSSMFLPQVPERDIFDTNNKQEDDINTVIEYVDQVILGHHADTPEDGDDDSGQNFHQGNITTYYYEPFFIKIHTAAFSIRKQQRFTPFCLKSIPSVDFDIVSPPPDIC
ncbi:MAG: hypothetical protein ABI151_09735 [Chitinophagaceae bacterium]